MEKKLHTDTWRKLEAKTREWAKTNTELFIDSDASLTDLVSGVSTDCIVSLDTEFVREISPATYIRGDNAPMISLYTGNEDYVPFAVLPPSLPVSTSAAPPSAASC